ncbi:Rieske 2Fe-2S domain-containing protein [Roseovarius sp. 2305UL8-3]|uniref:Rieske 2Fe-2S domain-containing protein n=1 Tax=Roseovarius conchicola TaxID=3121636 RepID=UPI00352923AB
MSVKYIPVQWNRFKYIYDAVVLAAIMAFLWVFVNLTPGLLGHDPAINPQIHNMRAFGACAFFLMTAILLIGPLARLDSRFLPLLYNRRHLGVLTCFVAYTHAGFVIGWYFSFSPVDKYAAVLGTNTTYGQLLGFPFESFGIFALFSLTILTVTSHDFWLKFLTPRIWKALHYLIYPAYIAVVAHIGLGALQDQQNQTFGILVVIAAGSVVILHLLASRHERTVSDPAAVGQANDAWESICAVGEIDEGRAKVARLRNGDRVAVFRHDGKLSAIANACAHQNGPLGEGRILDCLVTCPWHGFQYDVTNGRSPAPFTEKVPTYNLRLNGDMVEVDPEANLPGTPVEPLVITTGMSA